MSLVPHSLVRRFSLFWRRGSLWSMLVLLVVAVLVTLVWLAGLHEASQVQVRVERDAAEAVSDVRTALSRNVQDMQALQGASQGVGDWASQALALLHSRRELLRIEWRDASLATLSFADSPFRTPVFARIGRESLQQDVALTCAKARRFGGPAYSTSHFVPQDNGIGEEVMDLCLPLTVGTRLSGYLLASYSLPAILSDIVGPQLERGQSVSFNETDGTRLALHGLSERGSRIFSAQQVVNLPGNTFLLRLDSWRAGPDLFPNVLTALVTLLSIALLSVLALLSRDMRRRLAAERNLADALAFRKAMEDSLVTGLLARDVSGRIRYVNPAFCQMVGYPADALLALGDEGEHADAARGDAVYAEPGAAPGPVGNAGVAAPPAVPFWPRDVAQAYHQKQLAQARHGGAPAREGIETVFLRRDGSRFPVLVFDAPLINAVGVQTGWMSAFVDISEQRRVEERSRASQERLQATARLATVGEMASLLSHELNQPLAAIASYATGSLNLLGEPGPTPVASARPVAHGLPEDHGAELRVALRRIAEQADRAGKVIKSVQNVIRRRNGERLLTPPEALLEAVMPLVSLQASKLGVRVQTLLGDALPLLLCDRTMLEQVLLNLARNGMQAMDHPGVSDRSLVCAIRADPQQGGVTFSVADAGLGIPADVAQQLFTPFFTTRAEGMGLGLSLCRTVVEQHGGNLEFESLAPQGTIFRFTLPARFAGH